jgi:hypothetical protein
MLPLIPVPESILSLLGFASLADYNSFTYFIAVMFGFLGALWIVVASMSENTNNKTTREYVRSGFIILGAGVLTLVLGLYVTAILLIGAAGYISYALVKGVRIALSKE